MDRSYFQFLDFSILEEIVADELVDAGRARPKETMERARHDALQRGPGQRVHEPFVLKGPVAAGTDVAVHYFLRRKRPFFRRGGSRRRRAIGFFLLVEWRPA